MKKECVTYVQALALKELGYNEFWLFSYLQNEHSLEWELESFPSRNEYHGAVTAPLKQQIFKWFREKHGLHIGICHQANNKFDCWTNGGYLLENGKYCDFDTYEEAESACIDRLIQIAKQK